MLHASQPTRTDARTSPPTHEPAPRSRRVRCRRRRVDRRRRGRARPGTRSRRVRTRGPAPARELVFDRRPVRGVVHVTDDVDVGRAQRPRRRCARPGGGAGGAAGPTPCGRRRSRPTPRRTRPAAAIGAPRSGSVCTQIAVGFDARRVADAQLGASARPSARRCRCTTSRASTSARKRGVDAICRSSRRRIHRPIPSTARSPRRRRRRPARCARSRRAAPGRRAARRRARRDA